MQLAIHTGDIGSFSGSSLVLGLFKDEVKNNLWVKRFDQILKGELLRAIADENFEGKSKQTLNFNSLGRLRTQRLILIGLGGNKDAGASALLALGSQAVRQGNHHGAKDLLVVIPQHVIENVDTAALVARGVLLGDYRFDRYKKDKGRNLTVTKVQLHLPDGKATSEQKESLTQADVVSRAVKLARDLVNEPANEIYPESLAGIANKVAKSGNFSCRVYEPSELKKLNMNLLLAVGQGSDHTPRLVHLSYQPKGGKKASKGGPIVLVGKGITFDSGGLCLKGSDNMMDMKNDMAGSAVVLAALQAIAELKPNVAVHGLMALAENMPSGTSYRLGDVIRAASGRSVEINNTDAEGRLVLADALHYAVGLKPSRIVDVATLTGACVVALGPHTVGLFSNDDHVANDVLRAAKTVGEDLWRLPLTAALKEQLKSEIADTKNTGQRYGGAITAALFLQEFVDKLPWAHLDIAGSALSDKEDGVLTKGATGVAVATLVEFILQSANS